jgi:aminocarboxymuconate-semialdehyde decarboxylase
MPGKQRARKKPIAIDVHSHVTIPEADAMVETLPDPEQGPVRSWAGGAQAEVQAKLRREKHPKVTDLRVRLAEMDKLGFDIQAVSANFGPAFYHADGARALEIARVANEGVAHWVSQAPDRFVGFCAVPLQDAALAAAELERSVKQLRLRGAWILSNIRGRDLGEEQFRPFWAKAQELNVPVFVHPLGFTSPERLQKAMLWSTIGQPLEEALAISSLVYEGIMDAFPRLKVGICHGGGFFPYYIGRHDNAYRTRAEVKERIKRRPSAYIRRFFYDTVIFDPDMLEYLVRKAGDAHVVLGSDFPWNEPRPVGFVSDAKGLSKEAKERLLWRNAASLLKLSL